MALQQVPRKSDKSKEIREPADNPSAPEVVKPAPTPEVFGGKTLQEVEEEIAVMQAHLYREGIDFQPKALRVTRHEADEMVVLANAIMSGDPAMIDSPDQLSKAKSKLSALTIYMGEIYTQYEALVAREWLLGRADFKTIAEADKWSQTTENYRRMRMLRYRLKGLDRLITSIRDRLNVLGMRQEGPPNY